MTGFALCRCGPEQGAEVTAPRRLQDNRTEGPGVSREGTVDLEKHGYEEGCEEPSWISGRAAVPGQPGADLTGGRDGAVRRVTPACWAEPTRV